MSILALNYLESLTTGALVGVDELINVKTRQGLDRFVIPQMFGAKGDGVTNDTAAINAAIQSGYDVNLGQSRYLVDYVNLTKSGQSFLGAGPNTFLVASPACLNSLMYVNAGQVNASGFQIDMGNAGANAIAHYSDTGSNACVFTNIRSINNKRIGFYSTANQNCHYVNCFQDGAYQLGFQFAGAKNVTAFRCESYNTQVLHNFQGVDSSRVHFIECKASGSKCFNYNFLRSTGGKVTDCVGWDSQIEGINLEDSTRCDISGNDIYWTVDGISHDFGISVFGNPANAGSANHNSVTNNRVTNSGKSGIALASNVQFTVVSGNNVLNANRIQEAFSAGILLYGSGCTNNIVTSNVYFDSVGRAQYGVAEGPDGSGGQPSNNRISLNHAVGMSVAEVFKRDGSYEALNGLNMKSYTATAGASGGALGTYTGVGRFVELGKLVFVDVTITVSNVGTATGALSVSLPFPADGNTHNLGGRSDASAGSPLTAIIGAGLTYALVRNKDNGFPATNGEIIRIEGWYVRA